MKATPITAGTVKRKGTAAPHGDFRLLTKSKKIGVRLDNERYVRLRTYAAQHDMTGEQVMIAALDAYLEAKA
jgi:hypothetical protein